MKFNELNEYAEKMFMLKSINRFNNTFRIKEENVMEHIAMVAKIVLKLYDYYSFDLKTALIKALIHDDTEIYLSDIPSNVKQNFPELKKLVEEIEEVLNKRQKDLKMIDKTLYLNNGTVEDLIVKLADVYSVWFYSNNEIKMGNKGYMVAVRNSSMKKIKQLTTKLKKYNVARK